MQTGRDVCISIVLSTSDDTVLVSPAYTTFTLSSKSGILPEYMFMWFCREESDRYGWFISDSSVRSNLDWPRFLDIKIPVPYKDGEPNIERQQEVVDVCKGLKQLKEENEALAEPLLESCQSEIEKLKHTAPKVELGEVIQEFTTTNSEDLKLPVCGVNIDKELIESKAKITESNLKKYLLVQKGVFIFNGLHVGRDECLPITLVNTQTPVLVSPAYSAFTIKDEKDFIPEFLFLLFCRKEFDRYCGFICDSSVRGNLVWSRFKELKVPKPSLDVQKAIVDIYLCAKRAKEIAEEADQQLKTICPALMQHIIHG